MGTIWSNPPAKVLGLNTYLLWINPRALGHRCTYFIERIWSCTWRRYQQSKPRLTVWTLFRCKEFPESHPLDRFKMVMDKYSYAVSFSLVNNMTPQLCLCACGVMKSSTGLLVWLMKIWWNKLMRLHPRAADKFKFLRNLESSLP